jgi:hypothetical protein
MSASTAAKFSASMKPMLDADKLLPAVTQSSKYLDLAGISPHQTSRRRSEGRNSLLRCEGHI